MALLPQSTYKVRTNVKACAQILLYLGHCQRISRAYGNYCSELCVKCLISNNDLDLQKALVSKIHYSSLTMNQFVRN